MQIYCGDTKKLIYTTNRTFIINKGHWLTVKMKYIKKNDRSKVAVSIDFCYKRLNRFADNNLRHARFLPKLRLFQVFNKNIE